MTRAPLTTDRAMLDTLVDQIQLNALPDGTAIGVALANAASRLKDSQAKSKVAVLVTDGINNAGEIDPLSAAAVCEGLGIKVYTVGVGGSKGLVNVPMPTPPNPLTGRSEMRYVQMQLPVDEPLLRSIAQRTGGRFFLATDPQSLRQIFREIDRLEKTPLQIRRYVRYQEVFPPLVWSALGLLLLPFATAFLRVTAEP
jgi:Ca-activated chloride channel homolog